MSSNHQTTLATTDSPKSRREQEFDPTVVIYADVKDLSDTEEGEPCDPRPSLAEEKDLSDTEEGEPCDPRATVAEEINLLQQIETYLEISFDKKIGRDGWNLVDSALDSEIHEIKAIATRIFSEIEPYSDHLE